VTTVASPAALALTKVVSDLTTGSSAATADNANPGDTLQYTLTVTNNGAQPVSALVRSRSAAEARHLGAHRCQSGATQSRTAPPRVFIAPQTRVH